MQKPQIIIHGYEGFHNLIPDEENLKKNAYKDLSTICIVPTRGQVPAKIVQTWMGLIAPDRKSTRLNSSH